jgi:hypothetical protein
MISFLIGHQAAAKLKVMHASKGLRSTCDPLASANACRIERMPSTKMEAFF